MRTVNNSQQPDSVINNTSNTDQSTESDQSQNSSNQQPFSSSLRRRILASNTSFPLNPYQQLLEQMNHDFEWGLERSQAVARLRQRMNLINYLSNSRPTNQIIPQLTTTTTTDHTTASDTSTTFNQSRFGPRNLVGTLHQIRNRKAPVNHLHSQSKALVVYCGNDPELGDLRTTGTTPKLLNRQSGCGRLISIRATTPLELSLLSDLKNQSIPQNLPQPDDQNHSRQEMISLKDRLSRHSFVSSDCFPTPNSVGAVDDETRLDFERDQASNPFNSKSFFDTYCKCHLTYLGCLSCGNIVGHHTKVKCGYCVRNEYPFFFHYYLNRVTVLPRLSNQTIPLTVETKRPRDSVDDLNYFDIATTATDRSRTTANIDKRGKLLAWQDVCDLHTKDESLGLIGSHWDMVDELPLVMTNPTIKPMSSIISDAIMANSSLDLKPLTLNVPQRLSNQHILYNSNTAAAAATPYSNINNYSSMMTDGTDSPRGGAESNRRSRLRRTGAIHRPERTLQRSEDIVIPMILRNSSSSFSSSSENRPTTRTSYRIGRIIIHTVVEDDDGNEDLGEGRSWIDSDNTRMIEGGSVNDDAEDEEDWEEHVFRAGSEPVGIEDEPIMRALEELIEEGRLSEDRVEDEFYNDEQGNRRVRRRGSVAVEAAEAFLNSSRRRQRRRRRRRRIDIIDFNNELSYDPFERASEEVSGEGGEVDVRRRPFRPTRGLFGLDGQIRLNNNSNNNLDDIDYL